MLTKFSSRKYRSIKSELIKHGRLEDNRL